MEIAILFALLLLNGAFAMPEIALVTAGLAAAGAAMAVVSGVIFGMAKATVFLVAKVFS